MRETNLELHGPATLFPRHVRAASLSAALLCSSFALTGCPTEAEAEALDGLDAFEACDLSTATSKFRGAYEKDDRPDFALAYALSEMATMADEPELQALLPRFGFEGGVESSFLWKSGGVLDQMSTQTVQCHDLFAYIETSLNHRSINERSDYFETMDDTLTLGDLLPALRALRTKAHDISDALVVAANKEGSSFELSGGCGVDALVVQDTEILFIAAAMKFVAMATELMEVYDPSMRLEEFIHYLLRGGVIEDTDPVAHAARANTTWLNATGEPAVEAKQSAKEGLDLAIRALDLAIAATGAPANALFDWSALRSPIFEDMRAVATSARYALEEGGLHPVPFVTPTMTVDAARFFDTPFDLNVNGDWLELRSSRPNRGYLKLLDNKVIDALVPYFGSEDDLTDGHTFELEERWDVRHRNEFAGTLDPNERWHSYTCK